MSGRYHEGQACQNGHLVAGSPSSPKRASFCPDCGAATITHCPNCPAPLRGDWEGVRIGYAPATRVQAYCGGCGKAYPWTAAKLDAVAELADAIEELTDHERAVLSEMLPHLIQETPRTQPAGFKVATILGTLKGPGKIALRRILEEVAIEGGKKALGF